MRTITVTLYKYDELPSEMAKENARNLFVKFEQEKISPLLNLNILNP